MVTESEKSKHDMLRAMRKHIRENGITDFTDFQDWSMRTTTAGLRHSIADFRRLSRNTSTGVFIREEVEPVDGFTSEKGIGT